METKKPRRADSRKYHLVYKTTCIVTGKWYIGLHSTDDLDDGYLGSGSILSKSVKKYGRENHKCEILKLLPTRLEAANYEEYLLTEELRAEPMCMNIARGGIGYHPRPEIKEAARKKMAAASKAFWDKLKADPVALAEHNAKLNTPEHVAKRANGNRGKKRDETAKTNLAAGQQKYYQNADKAILSERGRKAAITRKERGNNLGGRPKGTPMSDEQKLKQSKAMQGKPMATSLRVCCMICNKETTAGALTYFHKH